MKSANNFRQVQGNKLSSVAKSPTVTQDGSSIPILDHNCNSLEEALMSMWFQNGGCDSPGQILKNRHAS